MYIEPIHTYFCTTCNSTVHADGCVYDEYYGEFICSHCGDCSISIESSREPQWFSVGVYETWRAYGGPEEGGWYYTHGFLISRTVRTFTNSPEGREEAQRYVDSLLAIEYCSQPYADTRYTDRVFSESLPDSHFPKNKPIWS